MQDTGKVISPLYKLWGKFQKGCFNTERLLARHSNSDKLSVKA